MVSPKDLIQLVNRRLNRLLLVAEAAMPPEQYKPFRRLVLDEFGWNGLEEEFKTLLQRRP